MIKIRLDQLTDRDVVKSLGSTICPHCEQKKKERHTLCGYDYWRLSRGSQRDLYKRLGDGYRQAVVAALTHLGSRAAAIPDDLDRQLME